jgi:hypothetical protein
VIRGLVSVALLLALVSGGATPTPESPPTIALGLPALYRLEVALMVFYGCLLLITPAFAGLARGRLPIEVSARGAKFAAEADGPDRQAAIDLERLESRTSALAEGLTDLRLEVAAMRHKRPEDKRQQGVGCRR